MASPTESLSAPCTLNYNDDEQLLQVDIPAVLLPEAPGGAIHPFSSTILYNSVDDFSIADSVAYKFRTGSGFAAVIIGSLNMPNSQLVLSNHRGIKGEIYDSSQGKWSPTLPPRARPRL